MLAGVVEIEIHLAGIGMGEFPKLQFHNNQRPKSTVKEEQVYSIPFRADPKAFLSRHEGEIVLELQQELFELANSRIL
jgi:hypothetical protein